MDWEKLLADLEEATRGLAAAGADESNCLAKALEDRMRGIRRLQSALETDRPPAETGARLVQIRDLGQSAVVRMMVLRDALRTRCHDLNREAQQLRRIRPLGGASGHSVDYSG